jgi:long-chain fatty acid transport protein
MNKYIKLIVLSTAAISTLSATNGDTLTAVGAKARAMGGAGIALSHGAESTLMNPALITQVESTEISFGGTIFMPDISTDMGMGAGAKSSTADMNVIPEVAIAHKINENLYIGIGMFGTAGMGVDFRNEAANMKMVTNLQLMQFSVPVAYKGEGFSIGIAPVLQYGALDIGFDASPIPMSFGQGVSQDLAFGYNLGATYNVSSELTLGAVYKSAISMNYEGQISGASATMGLSIGDALEQPAEIGVGIGYVSGKHSIAADYKVIQWSDSKGYSDFGWVDQKVTAIGYEYAMNETIALRAGYNHAKSPIVSNNDPRINTFNLLGFPATAEDHITTGIGYKVSKAFSVDLSYIHALNTSKSLTNFAGVQTTVDHAENSISFQLNYNF